MLLITGSSLQIWNMKNSSVLIPELSWANNPLYSPPFLRRCQFHLDLCFLAISMHLYMKLLSHSLLILVKKKIQPLLGFHFWSSPSHQGPLVYFACMINLKQNVPLWWPLKLKMFIKVPVLEKAIDYWMILLLIFAMLLMVRYPWVVCCPGQLPSLPSTSANPPWIHMQKVYLETG